MPVLSAPPQGQRRKRRLDDAAGRRLLVAVFVAYLAVVAFGVFGPAPGDPVRRAGDGVRRVADEVVPGRTRADSQRAARDEVLFFGLDDAATANLVMFVPLGVLFPLVFPRWRWWTVGVGVALTATIELTQRWLSWRSSSIDDVRWNSLGALIGFSLWLMAWAWRRRRPARN